MSTLLLKFRIILNFDSISDSYEHSGPLFHRWLPDGMKDAIILNIDQNTELEIWFERFGYVDGPSIEFDYHRQEVDPNIIPQQAILEAGPLMGMLKISEISEEELYVIKKNSIENEKYIKFGKKIVNKLIYPHVASFIHILRTNYSQYWIQDLEKWDSRNESLGRYCSKRLHLNWSLDDGKTWSDFIPNKPIGQIHLKSRIGFRKIFRNYSAYKTLS